MAGPLLTNKVNSALLAAARAGTPSLECSLDLDRTRTNVELHPADWTWQGERYPYMQACKERTIYHWTEGAFAPVQRFTKSLIKLVPTEWGPPTFEIDGIKMLPTAKVSPYEDAKNKVGLIQPRGKQILDTCGGLGYFAAWCLAGGASRIQSYEKSADVLWLRGLNPWSPPASTAGGALTLIHADVIAHIDVLPDASFDAVLHDPPRFGTAGELYSQSFYDQLSRLLRRKGRLFHYTGTPNKLTSGRDVPGEVTKRLQRAGFDAKPNGDGVLAVKT
jgi:predicted methyltransferase